MFKCLACGMKFEDYDVLKTHVEKFCSITSETGIDEIFQSNEKTKFDSAEKIRYHQLLKELKEIKEEKEENPNSLNIEETLRLDESPTEIKEKETKENSRKTFNVDGDVFKRLGEIESKLKKKKGSKVNEEIVGMMERLNEIENKLKKKSTRKSRKEQFPKTTYLPINQKKRSRIPSSVSTHPPFRRQFPNHIRRHPHPQPFYPPQQPMFIPVPVPQRISQPIQQQPMIVREKGESESMKLICTLVSQLFAEKNKKEKKNTYALRREIDKLSYEIASQKEYQRNFNAQRNHMHQVNHKEFMDDDQTTKLYKMLLDQSLKTDELMCGLKMENKKIEDLLSSNKK